MKKLFIFTCLLFVANGAFAVTGLPVVNPAETSINNSATLGDTNNTVSIPNPLVNIDTPQAFIGQLIKGLLGIVGTIALVMFVYGGFKWMTSMGNSKKVDEGKDTMLWATLGLIVIFSSYAMVKFVIDKVAG